LPPGLHRFGPFGQSAQRLGLGLVVFGLGERGLLGELAVVLVRARQDGERVPALDLVGSTCGGVVVGDGEGDRVRAVAVAAAG
jgi:hypothetical protein